MTRQQSQATVEFRPGSCARQYWSSRDHGWSSVLLRQYESARVAEHLETPALEDLFIVVVTQGTKLVESWDGARWHSALHAPGRFFMAAPGSSSVLRWRCIAAEPLLATHVYLPGAAVYEAVEGVWQVDRSDARMPGALAADDSVVERVTAAMVDAAHAGADDFYAQEALAYLAVHVARRYVGMPAVPPASLPDARVRRARDFMTDNMSRQLTLAEIAASVNLSQYHFLRLFRQSTGETPLRYLTRVRVEASARLLENDSLTLAEIAAQCGFSSTSHLSTAFRRRTGLSPRGYRQSQ